MEKPKIIICATAYRPLVGGAEIAIEEVARRLAGDFDIIIITARMSRRILTREAGSEGTIVRLGLGMPLDKWLLPFLIPWYVLSRFHTPDSKLLMWGMDISQGALAAFFIARHMPRLPYVLTVQYGESEAYLNTGRGGWIRRSFRAMLMAADSVTVISLYLHSVVRSHGYCGPCAVIPNGVDMAKFQIPNHKLQKSPTSEIQKSKTVMTISRLVPKNGVDVLIRAIARVKKEIPDIQCRIAGDGPERAALAALASELGVHDAVVFLGTVPHGELAGHLAGAAVFVRMSRSEGMGNAFIEAIAAGVPVIGTAVGGIPDIIEDGNTGLLAAIDDPADCAKKIIQLLRDPVYAQAMAAQACEKIIHRFDWNNIADQYKRIFYQLLGAEKRITIATGLFPPDIGGPATYTALLADALAQEKISVRVSYFGAVRRMPRMMRHAMYFLRLLFTARGSDIIFAQDPVSVGLPALVASRMLGTRFILKIVGDYAWEQEQAKNAKRKARNETVFETPEAFQNRRHGLMTEARRWIQRFVARHADQIIVPSQYLRGIVAGWGVAAEKIMVVYNAVVVPEYVLPREETRKKLGLSGMVIIAVGRMVPWKGFATLIDAVADLAADLPDLYLVIAGSGPEEEYLRRKIRERGMEKRVHLPGAVAHEKLMTYLAASEIFVLNSGYEGLSHTLIEAMAIGLPVVATAVGGNPEVVTDGAEGILIGYNKKEELKDAIRTLCRDRALRSAMGVRAQARASCFAQEKMIRETAMILKSL